MALGLVQFLLGTRHLSPESSIVPNPLTAQERAAVLRKGLVWLAVAAVFYGVVGRRRASSRSTGRWSRSPSPV